MWNAELARNRLLPLHAAIAKKKEAQSICLAPRAERKEWNERSYNQPRLSLIVGELLG